jgi:peptidoglycan-associated lipoprotein
VISNRVDVRAAPRRRGANAGGVMRKFLFVALIAGVLAGCQTTPTTDTAAPIDDKTSAAGTGASTSGAGDGRVTGITTGSGAGGTGLPSILRDPNNILSKRSVYFDFDSFVVREEFKPVVEAHAKFLQQNRTAKMTIQGHTDERGSREYNIALAQKRSDAVKRMMLLMGATEIQIETVSFGKEKPRNLGHDETAWAENRRDDILYVGE